MWKFQILREINFGHFEAPKSTILTIWAAINFEFWDISHFQVWIFVKNQNSKPPKLLKLQFLTFWNLPKLISRKVIVAGKLLHFHTMPLKWQGVGGSTPQFESMSFFSCQKVWIVASFQGRRKKRAEYAGGGKIQCLGGLWGKVLLY